VSDSIYNTISLNIFIWINDNATTCKGYPNREFPLIARLERRQRLQGWPGPTHWVW